MLLFVLRKMSKLQPQKKIRLNSGKSANLNLTDSEDKDNDNQKNLSKGEYKNSKKVEDRFEKFKTIREQEVGLTEYADASIPGFSAIVKQRYKKMNFIIF